MASKPLSKKRSNPKKVKTTPIAERPIPISAKEYVKTPAAACLITQLYATMFLMSVHSDHIEEELFKSYFFCRRACWLDLIAEEIANCSAGAPKSYGAATSWTKG